MTFRSFFGISLALVLSHHLSITQVRASDLNYNKDLEIAEKSVVKRMNFREITAGLQSSAARTMRGRSYRNGESFVVAAWQVNHSNTKVSSDTTREYIQGGLFKIRLKEKTPSDKATPVEINPLSSPLFAKVDKKQVRTELVPIDVTLLTMRESLDQARSHPQKAPVLPPQLRATAEKLGFKPDPQNGRWFDETDFWGRPVRIFWEEGDPWPTYMESSNGISILVHEGARS